MAGTFTLKNYWTEGTTSATVPTAGCTILANGNQTPPTSLTVNNKPRLNNLAVTGVTVVSGTGTVPPQAFAPAAGTDGTTSETTTIDFNAGADSPTFEVRFTSQGWVEGATVESCTVDRSGNTWSMSVIWNKPWD
jgi:hypothetical protein